MNSVPVTARTPQLGVRGLPSDLASLAPGLTYGIEIADPSIRQLVIAHTLWQSLSNDQPCGLVLAGPPRFFLKRAKLGGVDLDPWIESGQLRIFAKRADAASALQVVHVHSMLGQLTELLPARGALVVLEAADGDFCLPNADSVNQACGIYSQWAEHSDHVLLAIFDSHQNRPKHRAVMLAMLQSLGGHARVETLGQGTRLNFLHWCGALGSAQLRSFQLLLDPQRALFVPSHLADVLPTSSVVKTRFVASAGALDGTDGSIAEIPGLTIERTLVAIVGRIRNEQSCVTLVEFRQSQWEPLLGLAMTLLALRRPGIRLIIREISETMRSYQAVLLQRLGATLVPKGYRDAHVRVLLDAQAGLVSPDASPDRPAPLPRLPGAAYELVPQRRFKGLTLQTLRDSEALGLPLTLMTLPLPEGESDRHRVLDALRSVRDMRVCQTATHLVATFFACTASQARRAWQRSPSGAISRAADYFDQATDIRHLLVELVNDSASRSTHNGSNEHGWLSNAVIPSNANVQPPLSANSPASALSTHPMTTGAVSATPMQTTVATFDLPVFAAQQLHSPNGDA